MVPMEALEGRYTPGMHRRVVQSAADAGMSLLRLWGGGIYPVDEWLDACDELGVLSMVDMMYANVEATPSPEQEGELRDNLRRMSPHPSVALYIGCNECMGFSFTNATPRAAVMNDFVMATVASEDDSRAIRSASPFNGYCTGVDRLTGFPNGKKLTSNFWPICKAPTPPAPPHSPLLLPPPPPTPPLVEYHGPYSGGGGWGMVNGYGTPNGSPFGPMLLTEVPTELRQLGPARAGYMRTETGATTMSSFESMSATLSTDQWGLESESMRERNYPCHSHILSYFSDNNRMDLSGIGEVRVAAAHVAYSAHHVRREGQIAALQLQRPFCFFFFVFFGKAACILID